MGTRNSPCLSLGEEFPVMPDRLHLIKIGMQANAYIINPSNRIDNIGLRWAFCLDFP